MTPGLLAWRSSRGVSQTVVDLYPCSIHLSLALEAELLDIGVGS